MLMTAGKGSGASSENATFDDAEIGRLFHSLAGYRRVALAVSGGADSTALMLLAQRWSASKCGETPQITILTVDHGLRKEAAEEAKWVSRQSARLGFAHHTLVWTGEKPKTGIPAAARKARYELMAAFCQVHDIPAIATAHTSDDQAETVMMRLARGSGVDGLSGMSPVSHSYNIDILRPLLIVSRARLEAFLRAGDQTWLEDPTNLDDHYERVRIRKALQNAGAIGLARNKLALTARRLGRARDALDAWTTDFLRSALSVHEAGFGEIGLSRLSGVPEEIGLRALGRLAHAFGGRDAPPPLSKVEAAYQKLCAEPRSLTLGGCQFALRRGCVLVSREYGRMDRSETVISPGQTVFWDRRFEICVPGKSRSRFALRPLGADGLSAIKSRGVSLEAVPRSAAMTLPGLWRGGDIVFAPFARFTNEAPTRWPVSASVRFKNRPLLFGARSDRRE